MIQVETTAQMQLHLGEQFDHCNILIMSAAVADARPTHVSDGKIKKMTLTTIELTTNPDLLSELASRKGNRVLVGFAAETSDHLKEARRKLDSKGM